VVLSTFNLRAMEKFKKSKVRYIILSSGIQSKCSNPLGNARIEGVIW